MLLLFHPAHSIVDANVLFFASLNTSVQLSHFVDIPFEVPFLTGFDVLKSQTFLKNAPLPINSTVDLYRSPIGRLLAILQYLQSWGSGIQNCRFATN